MQWKGRIGIDGIGQTVPKSRDALCCRIVTAKADVTIRKIGNSKVNQHNHVAHNQLETIYILNARSCFVVLRHLASSQWLVFKLHISLLLLKIPAPTLFNIDYLC